MTTNGQRELLSDIARDFYLGKKSVSELAKKYGISRYYISKYLDQALKEHLVTITIHSTAEQNTELEEQLQAAFPVNHIYVLKSGDNPAQADDVFFSFAAKVVQQVIRSSHIIGLTWGDTVYKLINHFNSVSRSDLTFTQFVGENMRYNSYAGSMRMVQKAAEKYDTTYHTISGPLYVLNDAARAAMLTEPSIAPTIDLARKMDTIICGIGTITAIQAIDTWKNNFRQIFAGINPDRIAGIVYGRPVSLDGHWLRPTVDKILGIPLEQVLTTPHRIAVIQNKFKTNAAVGTLRAGAFTDVIMDERVAVRIQKVLQDN